MSEFPYINIIHFLAPLAYIQFTIYHKKATFQ